MTDPLVFTIGHSNHPWDAFVALLRANEIACLVDVRSMPASRRNPQFNRPEMERCLEDAGIRYCYLGDRLGGKPKGMAGTIDYAKVAAAETFRTGLDTALDLAGKMRCCLMCAEKDPIDCHRSILVARHLAAKGAAIAHIHADGQVEPQRAFEARLMGDGDAPLLAGIEDLQAAYERRGRRMTSGR